MRQEPRLRILGQVGNREILDGMYKYLFNLIYTGALKGGLPKTMCKISACIILVIAICMHLIMVLTLTSTIVRLSGKQPFHIYSDSNGVIVICFLVGFILTMFYYNERRINKILEKYADKELNGLYGFMMIFIPVIVMTLTIVLSAVSNL